MFNLGINYSSDCIILWQAYHTVQLCYLMVTVTPSCQMNWLGIFEIRDQLKHTKKILLISTWNYSPISKLSSNVCTQINHNQGWPILTFSKKNFIWFQFMNISRFMARKICTINKRNQLTFNGPITQLAAVS